MSPLPPSTIGPPFDRRGADPAQPAPNVLDPALVAELAAAIDDQGFAIARRVVDRQLVAGIREVALRDRDRRIGPFELEASLQYPGAPQPDGQGGGTIRRLLMAQTRSPLLTQWIADPLVVAVLAAHYGRPLVCPLAHHNCLMTKEPSFSSETGWHQDVRYWSFAQPELCSVWLPLGPERAENGALRLVPGSHRETFAADRFDEAKFFRTDLEQNATRLRDQVTAELDEGDVLFFHARMLHAAGRNTTQTPKLAAVFTYRPFDNPPQPGTRSVSQPELLIH